MLCTCSQKKAMWYIERSLADKVCEEPLTVKLRFEPQGRESADEKYYLVSSLVYINMLMKHVHEKFIL